MADNPGLDKLIEQKVASMLSDPSSLPAPFLDYMIQYAAVNPVSVGALRAPMIIATGTTGATAETRWVGATTSGAPTIGKYVVGDYITTQDATIWICTVAGEPGTWVEVGGGGGVTAVDWCNVITTGAVPANSITGPGTTDTIANFTTSNASIYSQIDSTQWSSIDAPQLVFIRWFSNFPTGVTTNGDVWPLLHTGGGVTEALAYAYNGQVTTVQNGLFALTTTTQANSPYHLAWGGSDTHTWNAEIWMVNLANTFPV